MEQASGMHSLDKIFVVYDQNSPESELPKNPWDDALFRETSFCLWFLSCCLLCWILYVNIAVDHVYLIVEDQNNDHNYYLINYAAHF